MYRFSYAQSGSMVKKPLLTFLLLAFWGILQALAGDNTIKINNIQAVMGDEITVEVEVINQDEFVSFQFDVVFPSEFTMAENSVTLHRKTNHVELYNIVAPGILRIVAYSPNKTPFLGSSGKLVSFTLKTNSAVSGTYPLNIQGALLANAGAQNILSGTVNGTVTLDKISPAITWPVASAITYGQPLSASNLSGGSAGYQGVSVAGEFSFMFPSYVLNAGLQNVTVTFTPVNTVLYKVVHETLQIMVRKKTVTITPGSDQGKLYGSDDPVLLYTHAGLLEGGSISGSLGRLSGEDAGTYDFVAGSLSAGDNYELQLDINSPTFSISRKELIVTGATVQNKSYDGTTAAILAGVSLSGAVNGDDVALDALTGQFDQPDVGHDIPVTATLTLKGSKRNNYTLVQPTGLKADITPRVITVNALNRTKECNQSDPSLSYTHFPSLISGDTFSGSLTRQPGNTPGSYQIQQGTLALGSNYTLVFNGGTFTVVDNPPYWTTSAGHLNRTIEYNDAAGLALAQALSPSASDACDPAVTQYVKTSGTLIPSGACPHTGTITNTWYAYDNHSNRSNLYTQVITITDTTAPVFADVESVHVIVPPGVCETQVEYPEIRVDEVCPDVLKRITGLGESGSFPLGTTVETWVVIDKSGKSDTLTFEITVGSYNIPPVMDAVADRKVYKNTETVSLLLTGIDPASGCIPEQIAAITGTSDNQSLISKVQVNYTNGANTAELSIHIHAGQTGQAAISVTVKDNGGTENGGNDTSVYTFNLSVVDENQGPSPVQSIPVLTANPGESFEVRLNDYFTASDPDATLSYSIGTGNETSLPQWIGVNGQVLSGQVPLSAEGYYSFLLTVTDSYGLQTTSRIHLVITAPGTQYISGFVSAATVFDPAGITVYLYRISNGKMEFVRKSILSDNAWFAFTGLASGTYLLKGVVTQTMLNPQLMSTFHTSSSSVHTAELVNVAGNNTSDLEIKMLPVQMSTGNFSVSGRVLNTGRHHDDQNNQSPGNAQPAAYVNLVLKKDGVIVSSALSNEDGQYSFAGLSPGTYTVEVQILGYTQIVEKQVTLTSEIPDATHVDFSLWENGVITRVNEINQAAAFLVYPNPTRGRVNIETFGKEASGLVVYNSNGQEVFRNSWSFMDRFTIDLSGQPKGLYIMKILVDGQYQNAKIRIE